MKDAINISLDELSQIEDYCLSAVNRCGEFVCYSKGCELIEGYDHGEVLGKKPNDLYHKAKTRKEEKSKSLIMETLRTGKSLKNVINVYETNHHQKITSVCSTYPLFDQEQKLRLVLCVYREISDYLNMVSVINKQKIELKSSEDFEYHNGTKYVFESIVGESPKIKKCIEQAKIASKTLEPILIYGETGTGKELFAQSIHNASVYYKKNFVAVNCAAIPENLLESTLFGTRKGSFTGALDTKGLLYEAEGSTLFLDELNSMDIRMQSKLLRVLETGKYRRVGETEERGCSVRIISAVNREPQKLIQEGKLRADLYYRLAVFDINLPALRERVQDIKILTAFFLETLGPVLGKKVTSISPEVGKKFSEYSWPGNVRELRHVLHQSICMMKNNDLVLDEEHLPEYIQSFESSYHFSEKMVIHENMDLKNTLDQYEKDLIEAALEKNNFNITRTAETLNITRQSLHHKINKYELKAL